MKLTKEDIKKYGTVKEQQLFLKEQMGTLVYVVLYNEAHVGNSVPYAIFSSQKEAILFANDNAPEGDDRMEVLEYQIGKKYGFDGGEEIYHT